MRRLLATALAAVLLLSFAGLTLAAPPVYSDTATLTATVIPNDPDAFTTERGRIDFQSDPYRAGSQNARIVVWQCYADWWPYESVESGTPTLDRRTGTASIWFHNGLHWSGTLLCQNWTAWVALKSDWQTPISSVLSGSF